MVCLVFDIQNIRNLNRKMHTFRNKTCHGSDSDSETNHEVKIPETEERIQVTPENAKQYIGRNIVFTTRGKKVHKTILGVSSTGKSIQIDHPDLNNNLQIVTRKVYLA